MYGVWFAGVLATVAGWCGSDPCIPQLGMDEAAVAALIGQPRRIDRGPECSMGDYRTTNCFGMKWRWTVIYEPGGLAEFLEVRTRPLPLWGLRSPLIDFSWNDDDPVPVVHFFP